MNVKVNFKRWNLKMNPKKNHPPPLYDYTADCLFSMIDYQSTQG